MLAILDNSQVRTTPGSGMTFDISTYVGDYLFEVRVNALNRYATANFLLQDSTDNFASDIQTQAEFSFAGEIQNGAPVMQSIRKYQAGSFRAGVAGAKARLFLQNLSGGASITFSTLIDHSE